MKKILLDRIELPNGIGIDNVIYVDSKDEYVCGYIIGYNKRGVTLSYVACISMDEHVLFMRDAIEGATEADSKDRKENKIKEITIADLEPIVNKDPGTLYKPHPWQEPTTIPLKGDGRESLRAKHSQESKPLSRPVPDTGTEERVGP